MYSSFENLEVYKLSITFTGNIYRLLERQPLKNDFAMVDQLRRATISNNISEGFERETDKELIRFLYFAKGSSGEVRNLFNVMEEIRYFDKRELIEYRAQIVVISKQLANYIKYVKRRCS
ncbi:unnamed protein product [Ectocarpus sp. 12 AP-2014]